MEGKQELLSRSLIACIISFLGGIKSGESLVIWKSAVSPHFAFWWMGGTRLGTAG